MSQCILYGKVKPVTRTLNFSLPNEDLSSVDIAEKKLFVYVWGWILLTKSLIFNLCLVSITCGLVGLSCCSCCLLACYFFPQNVCGLSKLIVLPPTQFCCDVMAVRDKRYIFRRACNSVSPFLFSLSASSC